MQDSFRNGGGKLLAILDVAQFGDVLLVAKKSSLDQNRGMSDVRNHVKLPWFRSAVDGVSPGDQRFLNKSGEALTFNNR